MRHSQPWLTARARVLRSNETSAEVKLWSELRNRQLLGLKFVRQAPIGPYFVDFVCRERCFIVEVDGATHGEPGEIIADAKRTADLEHLGFTVLRIQNVEVYENLEGVLHTLVYLLSPAE